ncbi:MAG: phosphate acyltransferase [Clostridia bacterium]
MLNTIDKIIAAAQEYRGGTIAVAAAHDKDVLAAVCSARMQGLCDAVLVGDEVRMSAMLHEMGEAKFQMVSADDDIACAKAAVKLVREGHADFLMKGLLNTTDMLRAVVDKDNGLTADRLLSHVMLYEAPEHKLLANTDGGMNPYPDVSKKADILENAATLMKALGYGRIYAACIAGSEVVSPKIQATMDAQALCSMTERWDKYDMKVFGPVGLDLAISQAAAAHKGYMVQGAGEADILLMPTYEVGNGIGKALTYFGSAKSAGIVTGARVPIVLVSRADSAQVKLASIALGAVAAHAAV